MSMSIRIAVTARNEAKAIGAMLKSLMRSVEYAEARLPVRYDVLVVLDECTDTSAEIARSFARVRTVESLGGKVEAQRIGLGDGPFTIFSDADIIIGENVVWAVTRSMLNEPDLQVAYPCKEPMAPERRTLMAESLYCYNRVNGFQGRRRYFNGKFFAIRDWQVPTRAELEPRLRAMLEDRFYDFHGGMRVDDIYLSRDILRRYGPEAIREVEGATVRFRPPETFMGMYRTYYRMRLEIERLNILFPETVPVHQRREYDQAAIRKASTRDVWLWRFFRLALQVCKVRYRCEKFYYQRLARHACPPWKTVTETKQLAYTE
jgi:glycosyltransferase involved in cell wall biosynthesis